MNTVNNVFLETDYFRRKLDELDSAATAYGGYLTFDEVSELSYLWVEAANRMIDMIDLMDRHRKEAINAQTDHPGP